MLQHVWGRRCVRAYVSISVFVLFDSVYYYFNDVYDNDADDDNDNDNNNNRVTSNIYENA